MGYDRALFQQDLVLIPIESSESSNFWTGLGDCVWNSPDWFTWKQRLCSIEAYRPLRSLFEDKLSIHDADLKDFIGNVCHIKRTHKNSPQLETSEVEKLSLLYGQIHTSAASSTANDEMIRYQRRS
jgi:hypothetical protein